MSDGITVVKCGGAAGVDPAAVCAAVADESAAGRRPVLVHGASAETTALAGRLGVRLRELTGPGGEVSRHTDAAALEVLVLALAGRVKPALVAEFGRLGVPAAGLTGLDAGLLRARRSTTVRAVVDGREVVVRDDHSGRLTRVDPTLPRLLLDAGLLPVVSPPALGEDGAPVNVNADRVAAALAVSLRAERLVLLTAAPGVLADPYDERSVRRDYRLPPRGVADPAVGGGMTVKLLAARQALEGGVPEVLIADGRSGDAVRQALAGTAGTRIALTDPADLR
ncbi:[LysW]-aminoadipate kinase [Nonomuraea fuscirosea]|uniref:[LysW]-aminoadipate kinase n=1 Tax=Nonomuraea fuscirosea TaxID=1291556 RepID=UPI0034334058